MAKARTVLLRGRLNERSGYLLWSRSNASVGREPLWDETGIGVTCADAPVDAVVSVVAVVDLINRNAVYVTRMCGVVGGVGP
jgi:hypothetical protein